MPIPLRADFEAQRLRVLARKSKDAAQARRLLALAAVYEGAARTEAAKIGGVTLQIVRDWVLRFNAHGPDGLLDRKAPGQPPKLNDAHRAALAAMIETGPVPAAHGVVRWRIIDLCQWLWEEFRVSVASTRERVARTLDVGAVAPAPFGVSDTDVGQAPKLQHTVERVDSDVHVGHARRCWPGGYPQDTTQAA